VSDPFRGGFLPSAFSGDDRAGRASSVAGGSVQRPRGVTGCATAAITTRASRILVAPGFSPALP